MDSHLPLRGRAAGLRGRRSECAVLDRLIEAARAGESRALVVSGEPGVGKTALLDYLAGHASGESRESGSPFASGRTGRPAGKPTRGPCVSRAALGSVARRALARV